MEQHEEESSHSVKRVVLPSGKTIEVVYFKDAEPTAAEPSVEPDQALHVCISCSSELAYPTAWDEAGPDSWEVEIRCPECETRRSGVFGQETVEAFDEQLDAGTDALMADYRKFMRANMAEELELFVAALSVGAIVPEDF
jgi:DNA-directed RNA polymerase subunit RPC12/RpoP